MPPASVSLGALGVITQYTLKCVPSYNLKRRVWVDTLDNMHGPGDGPVAAAPEFRVLLFSLHRPMLAGISHDVYDGEVTGRVSDEDEDTLAGLQVAARHVRLVPLAAPADCTGQPAEEGSSKKARYLTGNCLRPPARPNSTRWNTIFRWITALPA
jgi:hypothetical protein